VLLVQLTNYANYRLYRQETSNLLRTPNFVTSITSLVPLLIQKNPVHIFTFYSFRNILILFYQLRLGLASQDFRLKIFMQFHLYHAFGFHLFSLNNFNTRSYCSFYPLIFMPDNEQVHSLLKVFRKFPLDSP